MRIDTLPASLKDRGLWCVWKYEQRDGKPTKVPYNPRTGGRAQSNNPATFSDFKTAVAAFGRCQYDGMGIGVFPPFAAIDIDHCVEDGNLTAMQRDWTNRQRPLLRPSATQRQPIKRQRRKPKSTRPVTVL